MTLEKEITKTENKEKAEDFDPSDKVIVELVAAEDIPKGASMEVVFDKDATFVRLKR